MTEYKKSASKLKAEAEEVRQRLAKEMESVATSEAEAAEARKAQQKEKKEAEERLAKVQAELEQERKVRSFHYFFSRQAFMLSGPLGKSTAGRLGLQTWGLVLSFVSLVCAVCMA